jgi:hypothetical protein
MKEEKMETGQILFNLYFAFLGAYLLVILARLLRQNGRVLERMDEGFRKMLERMDEGFRKMDERAEERHREVIKMMEKADERTEKRHCEVIELIKALAGR